MGPKINFGLKSILNKLYSFQHNKFLSKFARLRGYVGVGGGGAAPLTGGQGVPGVAGWYRQVTGTVAGKSNI